MLNGLRPENIRDILIELDEQYTNEQIPLQERPYKALSAISRFIYEYKKRNSIPQSILYMAPDCGGIITLNSPEYDLVRSWYIQNYGDKFSPLDYYKFPFLVDKEIWPVIVNKLRGTPVDIPINDLASEIPDIIVKKIQEKYALYAFFWSDANDITFGFEKVYSTLTQDHEQEMFTSCMTYLRSTSSLFFDIPPNKSTLHNATLTVEMAFKAYFLITKKFGQDELKKNFRHNIKKLFKTYIRINRRSEMLRINGYLNTFSNINDRYTSAALPVEQLWTAYRVTIFIVASIIRNLSDQTCRGKIEKKYPTFLSHEF